MISAVCSNRSSPTIYGNLAPRRGSRLAKETRRLLTRATQPPETGNSLDSVRALFMIPSIRDTTSGCAEAMFFVSPKSVFKSYNSTGARSPRRTPFQSPMRTAWLNPRS